MKALKVFATTIFFAICLSGSAQYVFLPDTPIGFQLKTRSFFSNYGGGPVLSVSLSNCVIGNGTSGYYLDTTCATFDSITQLNQFQYINATDLSFLKYLHNLTVIRETLCGSAKFSVFPNKVRDITLGYVNFDTLPKLPDSLRHLGIGSYRLKFFTDTMFPPYLTDLGIDDDSLYTLPLFNNLINSIEIRSNHLTSIPPLPDSVNNLGLDECAITHLPPLKHLRHLSLTLTNSKIQSLPELPDTIKTLDLTASPISCLPKLPYIEYYLGIGGTNIECLPNYPNRPHLYPYRSDNHYFSLPLCTFFNTNDCPDNRNIKGKVYKDSIANCLFDSLQDVPVKGISMLLSVPGGVMRTYTKNDGSFSFLANLPNNYLLMPDSANTPFNYCPVKDTVTISATDSTALNENFYLQCKPGFDLSGQVLAGGRFRRNFDTQTSFLIGDQSSIFDSRFHCASGIGGTVSVVLNGPAHYQSSGVGTIPPSAVIGDSLIWTIADFGLVNPFNSFSIIVRTDSNAVIGDLVCFKVTVTPNVTGDFNLSNNYSNYCFQVRNSYDPNLKEVFPVDTVSDLSPWLNYSIQFQNTGNDTAYLVQVIDTLSQNLDLTTFEFIHASHYCIPEVSAAGIATFTFPSILLVDSFTNEPASHGIIAFRIKKKNNITLGSRIGNTAYIYFDDNSAIKTNNVSNQYVVPGGCNPDTTIISSCLGLSYLFGGHTLTQPGIYYDTLFNAKGCDSLIILHLKSSSWSLSIASTCDNVPYLFNGKYFLTPGYNYDTITAANGCDSVLKLYLTIKPRKFKAINDTICLGQQYLFGSQHITNSGVYVDTLTSINGCDSVVTLNLFLRTIETRLHVNLCKGSSYSFNGNIITTSGTYFDTLISVAGCDSFIYLFLTFSDSTSPRTSIQGIGCIGEQLYVDSIDGAAQITWIRDSIINSATYTAYSPDTFGESVYPYFSTNGSEKVVLDEKTNTVYALDRANRSLKVLRNNTSFIWLLVDIPLPGFTSSQYTGLAIDTFGQVYVSDYVLGDIYRIAVNIVSGTYTVNKIAQRNSSGMQPLAIFVDKKQDLYVSDVYNNVVKKFASGSPLSSNGSVLISNNYITSPAGIFVDPVGAIYVVNRQTKKVIRYNQNGTSVIPETVAGGMGNLKSPYAICFDNSGKLYVTDSTRIVQFPPNSNASTLGSVFAGGINVGNGLNQLNNTHGIYISGNTMYIADTYNSRLLKWRLSSITNTFQPTVPGNYYARITLPNGCTVNSSIVNMQSNVIPKLTINFIDTTHLPCRGDSVTLRATYSPFGNLNAYQWKRNNAVVGTLPYYGFTPLFGNQSIVCTGTIFACGVYQNLTSNTLAFQVQQPSYKTINASICNGSSFVLHGKSYSTPGAYQDTLVSSNGCDSILTINVSVTTIRKNITMHVCEGQGVLVGTNYITSSGTYIDTLKNGSGCDSIITLNLTVDTLTSDSLNVKICAGQQYVFNHQILSASGVYFDTLLNNFGCDSIARVLHLSVENNFSSTLNANICNGSNYLFNGVHINAAGTYTDTFPSSNGCDSIVTLHLNVLSALHTSLNKTLCFGETYLFNGSLISTAGSYNDTLTSVAGCDSIVTLHVDVLPKSSDSIDHSICDGEIFTFNGRSLIQAGVYTDTLITINGCDSIIYLTLTVYSKPVPIIQLLGNDSLRCSTPFISYQWLQNGIPLHGATTQNIFATSNGTYSVIVTDSNGCSDTSNVLNVLHVSILETTNAQFVHVYPNPFTNEISITSELVNELRFKLNDITGRLISEDQFKVQHSIDTKTLSSGIYYLHVFDLNRKDILITKLVKE